MSVQLSTEVRNSRLDAIETTIGASPLLRIYDLTGGSPANTAAAITATLLAEMTLGADWMNAASSGSKTKAGTWQDTSANATGVADFFRIYDSGGTVCHLQGTVTATSGGGDMELDNTSIASGQSIQITTFTLSDGNA